MKLFSMIMAMFFAWALSTAPAMAESKESDRYSDSGHEDKTHADDAGKDKRDAKDGKGAFERNAVDTRDVRRDAPAAPNRPVTSDKKPSGWLSY
ncbi:MAG: hypothetical protein CO187_04090 [Zetaproteobacteria bacterium CG_4_9_14_3_um_filter_53_7]|nr:MAG: hypothetical protein CO187_04090 [Zetaproteobacteria bacterium CG_4_9_14_3_um_filter_53_7]